MAGLKTFRWKLWIALSALALVPAVYQTIKTFLISSSGSSEAFNVIGQMEWFDLIDETLRAFLIVPLYSVLNKIFKRRREEFAQDVSKTGLIAFLAYMLFSIGVLIYGMTLVRTMNPEDIDLQVVANYLRLETFAFMIGIIISFVNVVFVVVGKEKNIYIFLGVRTVLALISDFLLIPNFGVYGVAASNILVNALLAIVSVLILYKEKLIRFERIRRSDGNIFKKWLKVGAFSGLQQFIDNLIYALMVVKMVNMIAEQGNYWNANNFIWGWLLIPIAALGEVIRSDCKEGYGKLNEFNYYFIVGAVVVAWAVSIPLWTPFYRDAEKLADAGEIFDITLKLAPFYIAYAGSAVIDSIFIGLGKTIYTAINSLVVNLAYYGTFYVLYLTNAITFKMDTIILMFGFGMIAHLIISVIEERIFRKLRMTRCSSMSVDVD